MDTLLRIEMLGRLNVRHGSLDISRFRTQKTAALLAYLAFYRQRSHPRDVLIGLFWPNSSLEAARSNLSVALNALRRQLETPGIPSGAILITDRSQVRLNPLAFTTDVAEFDSLTHEGEAEPEAEKRISLQLSALDLYHGELLPGFYEDWILTERDRLRDAYIATLGHVVRGYAGVGRQERALEYAHRMAQADPLREDACHDLMRLYMAVGRPEDALHQYEAFEILLQKERQCLPSSALHELAATLRLSAPSHRPTIESAVSTKRVREPAADIQRPIPEHPNTRIPEHPKTGTPPPRVSPPLPFPFTRFFGREAEIARLSELLRAPESQKREAEVREGIRQTAEARLAAPELARLITLTGPGGTGKTRLSIEAARRLTEAFSGGVWFVPLEEVYEPLRFGEALRDVLALPRQTQTGALDQVAAFLNGQTGPVLLILDNFEQITAGGSSLVWTLLNRVLSLQFLVTSRQPLSLPGEREVPLTPLPIPSLGTVPSSSALLPAQLMTYPGIALFVDRAQAVRSEFQITPRNAEAIAAISTKLEGIPLAIELAAARARVLTPAQILDRLAERFELLASRNADKNERHRSLWAAIDWSYHLLPPGLQRFFARLSVFRGGWTLEAAASVCEEPAALDYLAQLRSHSLVFAAESSSAIRFRMLESLREFAAEQLNEEEKAALARRHAEYFHQWATDADLSGSEQGAWYARFEEDLDNLRAVMAWSLQTENDIELGLHTAVVFIVFWRVRGHLPEGRRWYARLLEAAGLRLTTGRSGALYCAGALASLVGDFPAAGLLLEECRQVAIALGDEHDLALAYNELGSNASRQGEYAQAREYYEKYLSLARAQGTKTREAGALTNLASVAQSTGDYAAARAFNREGLRLWREAGERVGESRALHNLAIIALSERHLDEAQLCFEQSLEIRRELSDDYGVCYSLGGMAEVAKEQGNYAAALAYARESLKLARAQNMRTNLVDTLHLLIELAWLAKASRVAAQMCGTLDRAREEMNYPLPPLYRPGYAQMQTELQHTLGNVGYESAQKEGQKLTLEQALAYLEETLASLSL